MQRFLRANAPLSAPLFVLLAAAPALAAQTAVIPAAKKASNHPDPPSTRSASPITLQTVIVTANKRKQSVLNVAGTLDVITPTQIEDQGFTSLTQWAQLVPGMSFFGRGTPGFNQIILDGITSGSQQTSPTVAVYVNDAPFSFSIPYGGFSSLLQPDLDPFDLQNIEVLKGPQGTLYGASTLGGLIKYVTKQPNTSGFSVDTQLGTSVVNGGGLGYVARLALNIPLSSDLAVRISGFSRRDPGFITNLEANSHRANDTDAGGTLATLSYTPTKQFKASFDVLYQDSIANAEDSNDLNLTTMQPIYGRYDQSRFADEQWESKDLLTDGNLSLTLPNVLLQSTTSYAAINGTALFDYTPVLPPGLFGGSNWLAPQHAHYTKAAEDLRALSPPDSGPWNWIIGLWYTNELATPGSTIEQFGPARVNQGLILDSISHGTFEEYAAYGNITYTIAKRLSLTGGFRWSGNDQTSRDMLSGQLEGTALNNFIVQTGKSSASATTWSASANWRYRDNASAYVRIATGYRPGGPIEPPPGILGTGVALPTSFNSDSLIDYEIGQKADWFQDRLQTSISAHHINWSDIQLPFLINGFRELANGGGAISNGFSAEITARPMSAITTKFTASYIDSYLTTAVPLLDALSGNRLPYVPRLTVSGRLDYNFLLDSQVSGVVGVSWYHITDIVTSYEEDPDNRTLAGYNTFGAQATVALPRDLSINLYVQNLLNKYALTGGNAFGTIFEGVVLQPLTVGILVTKKFGSD